MAAAARRQREPDWGSGCTPPAPPSSARVVTSAREHVASRSHAPILRGEPKGSVPHFRRALGRAGAEVRPRDGLPAGARGRRRPGRRRAGGPWWPRPGLQPCRALQVRRAVPPRGLISVAGRSGRWARVWLRLPGKAGPAEGPCAALERTEPATAHTRSCSSACSFGRKYELVATVERLESLSLKNAVSQLVWQSQIWQRRAQSPACYQPPGAAAFRLLWPPGSGPIMSGPQTAEQVLDAQSDSSPCRKDEDAREGTQSSHRMLGFSDALLSIIATVMILPVTHTEISPEQQFDKSIQRLLATRIAVYLMTFLIVTVAWAAHTRLFQVVGKIDDTLALLNLACMMTITLLPYTFSLMVTFPDVPLGIFVFCVCVIAIGVVQALIVGYAFHFPHLLSPQIRCSAYRALSRRHILHLVLRGPALCFLAAIFSLFFFPVSYLLMVTVIFLPYISKATSWCKDRLVGRRDPPAHSAEVFSFDLHEPLSKERVEAFSDGVYAIVATLLILDICEDNVPDPKDVKEQFHGSLVAALGAYGPHFLAYFGSFATVGLLWFAHHSLFLHVRKATQAMGLLNTLSLAFVGGLPLAYQQTAAFARQPRDELERVRLSCAIVFFASIFQFAIWTAALLRQVETLQPAVRFGGQEHAFMFAKLALYPCASLLAFAATCLLSRFSTAIFHIMQIAVPFAFLLLRLLVRLVLATLCTLRSLHPAQPLPNQAPEEAQSRLLPSSC